MRPIAVACAVPRPSAERLVVGEGAQQLVVAGAGLVRARDDRIDDAEQAGGADAVRSPALRRRGTIPSRRAACSSARTTVVPTAMIRPPRARARLRSPSRSTLGNAVRLVERQQRIQLRIAGRRDAGGVGDGREHHACVRSSTRASASRARSRPTAARTRPAGRQSASTCPRSPAAPAGGSTESAGRGAPALPRSRPGVPSNASVTSRG